MSSNMTFSWWKFSFQSAHLSSCRIEEEITALEDEELRISSNETLILKRLKEVEKTPEDIIKVMLGQWLNWLYSIRCGGLFQDSV